MENPNFNEHCNSEFDEFNFRDIPDYISDIKKELLDVEIPETTLQTKDDAGLPDLKIKQQYNACHTASLNPLRNFHIKEILDEGNLEPNKKCEQDEEFRLSSISCGGKEEVIQDTNNCFYECLYCTYQTIHLHNYKRHIENHNAKEKIVHKCMDCGYQSPWPFAILEHMAAHTPSNNIDLEACLHCDMQTYDKNVFDVQIDITKGCFYQKCRNSEKVHVFSNEGAEEITIYKCPECNYHTKRKPNLIQHGVRHKQGSVVIMFSCIKCDYQSFNRSDLQMHELTHKSDKKMLLPTTKHVLKRRRKKVHQCDKCDYQASRKRDLNKHLIRHKRIDPEVKMYKCAECEYQTYKKSNIGRHMVRHRADHDTPQKKHRVRHKFQARASR